MPVDLNSFIRFTAHADGRATIGMGAVGGGAGSQEFLLMGTSSMGRMIATLKDVFFGPSEPESRAAQAFIQAICHEYGSEGDILLKRLGVDDHKPIRAFQVQQIAKTLDNNRANQELNAFREISAWGIRKEDGPLQATPMSTAIRSAMALHAGQASVVLDDLTANHASSRTRRLAMAVAAAVVSESPGKLMAIADFKAQYQKRLNLAAPSLGSPDGMDTPQQATYQVQVTGIASRLIEDIFSQATTPNPK